MYQRSSKRPRLRDRDRLLRSLLFRLIDRWRDWPYIAKHRRVTEWQRRRLGEYWARLSRPRRRGRPSVHPAIRALIRRMSKANVLWGAPRIVGELKTLGIEIAESTVAKHIQTSSPGVAHLDGVPPLAPARHDHFVDFFIVPTLRRQILFVFLVLSNE